MVACASPTSATMTSLGDVLGDDVVPGPPRRPRPNSGPDRTWQDLLLSTEVDGSSL